MKKAIKFALIIIVLLICGNAFAQNIAVVPQPPPAQEAAKISLDIKGMDVIDVLKMLSTRAGFNIAVGKNVTGRVTIFLKDVDVWDALEIILLSNDLAYDKAGNIINVMTQRDYELQYGERFQDRKEAKVIILKYAKAAELAKALTQIKSNIGRVVVDDSSNTVALLDAPYKVKEMEDFIKTADVPLETRVFDLQYAQADKIMPKLQDSVTKIVGSIKVDERTNKIAITDYPQKLDDLAKIIAAFDEKTQQVLIDAQIIEIRPSDKLDMGINWDYWIKKYFEFKAMVPINTPAGGNAFFATTAGAGTPRGPGEFQGVVDILRTIGDTKILSSPRIITMNNQEAKILVGTKDAYITSTTSMGSSGTTVTSQTVNFVDVGVKLYVTPAINENGFISMKIRPEVSSSETKTLVSEDKKTDVPIVTTSEAETSVVIKDGVTIIIGGLKQESRKKTTKRLPILGDIPLLGYFFGNTSDELSKKDLVILLTPHIISGESPYISFSQIPPKEGGRADLTRGKIVIKEFSESQEAQNNRDVQIARVEKYYKQVADKIRKFSLIDRPKGQKGIVDVSFTVDSGGRLRGEPRITSATNTNLVPAATRNIVSASPFPPFPKGMDKAEESFHISLEYN
jgi:type II secretory pathway component GspD/PulD (secretin)